MFTKSDINLERNDNEKAGPNDDPAFSGGLGLLLVGCLDYPFLNFLLNPARPSKPEPRRSMVAGSGTTVASCENGAKSPTSTSENTLL